ncbi:MAG: transglycosylase domain-containing protein [Clostridia bacterium]|nr:transglycosylase domain-containing protein [Clostridia bacterium]MDD4386700.1 transglycosylase domain-containing protein [Clostridia bacterium]
MRKGQEIRKKNIAEKKQLFKFKNIFNNSRNKNINEKSNDKNTNNIKNKKNKKLRWKIFKIFLFTMVALGIIGTGIVFGVISGVIDKTDSIELEDLQLLKLTSFIYDKDGIEIGNLYDSENRVTVEYKNLPKSLVDAVISIEDERFFSHGGVDIKRTAGAVFTFAFNGGKSSFGGSTITQQLVKTITSDKETSWTRKIREWYRAISLESKLTKEQIMESYLNTIYLGDGSYGVEVASQNYFGKSIKETNIAEAAILAAAIQTPENTNPYKSEDAKTRLLERKDLVLKQMLKLGKISQVEYDEASKYEIIFKKESISGTEKIQTYFVDAVIEQVILDLQEQKSVTRGVAIKMLYADGYKIYSTQDQAVQKAIDDAYNNTKLFYTDKKGDFMQSSMVVMDQSTGNVLGLIGGADVKSGTLTLNRATQTYRQPGSTMKPLGAYGPAFEQGVLAPGMGLDDSQFTLGNWTPGNYYGYFNGYVTARLAISKSMNIPAVRAAQRAGVDNAFLFAKNTGLVDLVEADKNLASIALGGVTKGFTVLEMANAYSTIANGGIYMTPKLYTKVLDKNEKEVLKQDTIAKKVMKDSTSFMLTDCLETVIKTGTGAGTIKLGNMPVAGKTGNTNDDYDQWFIGFSPYYTIACWNGYDTNKSIGYRTGIGAYPYTSMVLFNTVLNTISKGQEIKQFDKPSTIVKGSVCRISGFVATDACRNDPRGDQTITDIFASGSVPTKTCDIHKSVSICSETGLLATEFCPNPVTKSFITRDYVPGVKPKDWGFMIPTATCNIHTSAILTSPNNNEVNIY